MSQVVMYLITADNILVLLLHSNLI